MATSMVNEATRALRQSRGTHTGIPVTSADVVVATATCLGALGIGAVVGWTFLSGSLLIYLALMGATLALGIWVARRSPVSPALALGYSLVLGLMVGAFSSSASQAGGNMALIVQALTGTAAGAVAMLLVYSTPWGRKASRSVRLFAGIALGYLALGLVSLVSALFGVGGGWGFYGVGGIGLLLCLAGVALACWSLLIDIGSIDSALSTGADSTWKWSLGMSLTASLAWMYIEILRMLAIVNR